MLDKYIFNEDIKRVFNYLTNSQIIYEYLFKDYISNIKILNEFKKNEKIFESNSNYNNNKNMNKYNDSSKTIINNLTSKTNTNTNNSIHPIFGANNSFLYLNSSFRSINKEKIEGLLIECNWKKKYILLIRVLKINDSEQFYKSIDIECIEMNHYENPFNIEISLYWDTSSLQTILLIKTIPKDKLIEEILNRELNNQDKQKIIKLFNDYLTNDLTNLENCATNLIFASVREISLYLSDITKIIKFSPGMENKRHEVYTSSLINTGQNCRVYDMKNNTLWQEYIFSGYYADKKRGCQIRWEKKENNKIYCIYRISIIYLEENLSLLIFKNVYQTHVTSQYLSDINTRKKKLFTEIRNYFNQKYTKPSLKNKLLNKKQELKLIIGIKNNEDREEQENKNYLNMFIHNNSIINLNINNEKEEDSQFSLIQGHSFNENNYNVNKGGNSLDDNLKNISEIEIINSAFLFGEEEDNNN